MATFDVIWLSGHQFDDDDGNPLNAGTLSIYDSGTTSERTVYQDGAGSTAWTQPITLDSTGRLTAGVFVPTGNWKFTLKDSAGTTVATQDVIPGASGSVALSSEVIKQGLHSQYIDASSMTPATTSGAAPAQIETSSNANNYKVLDFDGSSDEAVHFKWVFPKSWDKGTITYRAHWESVATDTDGIALALQGVAVPDGSAMDVAYGTAVLVNDNAQSTAGEHLTTPTSSAVTIAGTPANADMAMFKVYRDVSDSGDTMAEDMRLQGIEIFYTIDAATDA